MDDIVRMEHVTFTYPATDVKESFNALNDLALSIEKGSFVAVILISVIPDACHMNDMELATLIGEHLVSELDQTITRTLLRNADHYISHAKPLFFNMIKIRSLYHKCVALGQNFCQTDQGSIGDALHLQCFFQIHVEDFVAADTDGSGAGIFLQQLHCTVANLAC